MKRSTFYVTLSAIFSLFVLPTSIFADGKFLIFSVPKERVQTETSRVKDPVFLVDLKSPYSDDGASMQRNGLLPENLASPDSNEFRFPIPTPTSRILDFGVKIPSQSNDSKGARAEAVVLKDVDEKSSDVANDAAEQSAERSVEPQTEQLAETEASESDKEVGATPETDGSPSEIDFELWNEAFSDDLSCNSPQYARDLKEYSRRVSSSTNDASADQKVKARYFHESRQQAAIAWNGKSDRTGRETMIVSTTSVSSNERSNAMLSVIPLPGPPIEITRVDRRVLSEVKARFNAKMKIGTSGSVTTPETSKLLGSHNIFVWKLENVDDFFNQVNDYVAQKYADRAACVVTPDIVKVVEFYFKKGFRYFAFDLAEVGGVSSEKETIAYTFQSTFVYYPLVVSRIGGEAVNTTVDLTIMTPDKIKPNGAVTKVITDGKRPDVKNGEATLVGGGNAVFTIDEVRKLDPRLAGVFDPEMRNVKVRNARFTGRLNGFTKDFTAVAAETRPQPAEDHSDNAEDQSSEENEQAVEDEQADENASRGTEQAESSEVDSATESEDQQEAESSSPDADSNNNEESESESVPSETESENADEPTPVSPPESTADEPAV